jgi:hypothetical protein
VVVVVGAAVVVDSAVVVVLRSVEEVVEADRVAVSVEPHPATSVSIAAISKQRPDITRKDATVNDLATVAPAFVEMAHQIVWCSAATVDRAQRPRTRILHPYWEWDGSDLTGWIATGPTPTKRAHLDHSPYLSCSYWAPTHDTCVADCRATWRLDDTTRERVWETFKHLPPPVGYDPALIPVWDSPRSPAFAVLELSPWSIRVFPGSVLRGQGGDVLSWREEDGR